MKSVSFAALAALSGALLAGCPSTVNQDACAKYVEHLNGLDCRGDEVSVEDTCPANYDDEGAANCAAYFECLTSAASCDGDTFKNDVTSCTGCEEK